MALVVDKADLLVQEIFKGLRQSSTTQYLALFGGSTLLYLGGKVLFQFLNGLRVHFFSRSLDLKDRFGTWAIVTGCTSGIGRALTIELAAKGLNIALIARNPEYLDELSKYLESNFKIQTIVIVADFKDINVYSKIKVKLEPIQNDIGILFNNVGMASNELAYFAKTPDTLITDMINTNICSVALMSKIALQSMEPRGRGAIVNVSSSAGLFPVPLMAIYSGTKGFVNHFSRNLHHEYSSKGIIIQNLTPMGVRTKMLRDVAKGDDQMIDNFLTPSATTYAQNVLRTLGKTRETTGYWRHSLFVWFISLLPSSFVGFLTHQSMKARLRAFNVKFE